jgi:small-conductance mechanosensitive channel
MSEFYEIFAALDAWTGGEGARLLATIVVLGAAALGLRFSRALLTRDSPDRVTADRRVRLVWSRNLVMVLTALALALLWGYKLTGFVFSLAAVAGALVIVNKELIQGLTGYALLTLTTPYSVGDYVQVSRFSGRVIDIRLMSTTLAETGSVHQLTGMTVTVPHSLLLTESVRNMSATGDYLVNLYRIVIPLAVGLDVDKVEAFAVAAAEQVTAPWRQQAEAHLEGRERLDFVDLPSARPKVLWESVDSRSLALLIRFACPSDKRVTAEQEIFRLFWRAYSTHLVVEKKPPESLDSEG